MVDQEALTRALSEFARTLLGDFPLQRILDHLVERVVEVLPITSAGMTLIDPGLQPRQFAASNEAALRFENLQTQIGEGPCVAAWASGERVLVPDLRADRRFPQFSARAVEGGAGAVFSFPLRHETGQLGALDLYTAEPGALDDADLAAAQTLADVATAYLLNAQARAQALDSVAGSQLRALHDPLTGLPNRTLLDQRINHAALRARRTGNAVAVLFLDLDRFKQVNDTYGHGIGDELLAQVAERLRRLVRAGDTLARRSGDEFVIVCEDLPDPSPARILARRIRSALTQPFPLSVGDVRVDVSVGIAFADRGTDVSPELVAEADQAMYRAKRLPTHVEGVIDLREHPAGGKQSLEDALRAALADGGLRLAYQPIIALDRHAPVGVEALLRWTDPHRGEISPSVAVATADRAGLSTELGAQVLERACADFQTILLAADDRRLHLAVNVSATQFLGPSLASTTAETVQRTGIDPQSLTLHVPEWAVAEDPERAAVVGADLKKQGIALALSIGPGTSGLSMLRRLPLDHVVIDRTLVTEITTETEGTRSFLNLLIALAHDRGLSTMATGVDNADAHDTLSALGCDTVQGHFYAQPMPTTELNTWLHAHPHLRPRTQPA